MGKSGKWTSFVGSLGSLTHVQWADGGAENAKKYPEMELVSEKNESFNDANKAYEKAREILRKYPDIKGFQGGSAIDVIGIGRAVEEAGLVGRFASSASVCRRTRPSISNRVPYRASPSGTRRMPATS